MPAAGILGWKRSKYLRPILHNSKSPETPRKLILEIIKILSEENTRGGPHPGHEGGGPLPRGPPGRPPVSIFSYMVSSTLEKIISKLTGRDSATTRRNQSRAPAELFLSGKLPSGRGKSSPSSSPTLLSLGEGNLHQHLHQHHLISKP